MLSQLLLFFMFISLINAKTSVIDLTPDNIYEETESSKLYTFFKFIFNHPWEPFGIGFIVFYIGYFIWGMRRNKKISKAWLKEYRSLFESQFTLTGISSKYNGFIHISHDEYRYFCSGRRNCRGLLATCKTKKRQDFFSFLIELIKPVEDLLTIDIPLEPKDLSPYVFALCRKTDVKKIHTTFKDLKDYGEQISSQYIPDLSRYCPQWAVISDTNEIPTQIVTRQLVDLIKNDHDCLRLIHITDQRAENVDGSVRLSTATLRLQFKIPSPENISELKSWMNYIFTLIDLLPTLHLSSQVYAMNRRARVQNEQRNFVKDHQ
ncbi:hypothetical protein WA158_001370 [Blastocystis sp. Blastoise]